MAKRKGVFRGMRSVANAARLNRLQQRIIIGLLVAEPIWISVKRRRKKRVYGGKKRHLENILTYLKCRDSLNLEGCSQTQDYGHLSWIGFLL